jgi:beta-lactamase regulating signal transducer with metallopeptidase domain
MLICLVITQYLVETALLSFIALLLLCYFTSQVYITWHHNHNLKANQKLQRQLHDRQSALAEFIEILPDSNALYPASGNSAANNVATGASGLGSIRTSLRMRVNRSNPASTNLTKIPLLKRHFQYAGLLHSLILTARLPDPSGAYNIISLSVLDLIRQFHTDIIVYCLLIWVYFVLSTHIKYKSANKQHVSQAVKLGLTSIGVVHAAVVTVLAAIQTSQYSSIIVYLISTLVTIVTIVIVIMLQSVVLWRFRKEVKRVKIMPNNASNAVETLIKAQNHMQLNSSLEISVLTKPLTMLGLIAKDKPNHGTSNNNENYSRNTNNSSNDIENNIANQIKQSKDLQEKMQKLFIFFFFSIILQALLIAAQCTLLSRQIHNLHEGVSVYNSITYSHNYNW